MFKSTPRASDVIRSPDEYRPTIGAVRDNCCAPAVAGRAIQPLERSAPARCDGTRRLIEEIAPIAHALDGLLEIMNAEGAESGAPSPAQLGLLRNWTHDLVLAVRRHQDGAAPPAATRADIGAIVDDAVALFRDSCNARGHTVVLSGPSEPILAPVDPQRLQSAIRQLMESVFEREGRDRHIDIVLWRSIGECRLAFVSRPPVPRGFETAEETPAPARPAGPADARFMGALAQLRELGAAVETSSGAAPGSNLLVSLPVA